MSDLFHKDVPVDFVREVFDVIAETPQHTYQVLTKRSKRLARARQNLRLAAEPLDGCERRESRSTASASTTLRKVGAAVRFVSAEPLLGPLADRSRRHRLADRWR